MTQFRKYLIPSLIAALLLGVAGWIGISALNGKPLQFPGNVGKQEIDVALLSRQPGNFASLHATCLNLLFDQLNQTVGNSRHIRFVLRPYDLKGLQQKHPKSTPYEALLAEAPGIAAVLDNTWGSDLLKSRDSIKSKALPVISLNADRTADFGHTVLFLGSQNLVYVKVANFIKQALLPETTPQTPLIVLLAEKDYGTASGSNRYLYEEELGKANLPLDAKITFTEEDFGSEPEQNRVASELKTALAQDSSRPIIAIINAHREWGSRLARAMELVAAAQPARSIRVIGHDSMFDQKIHDGWQPSTTDADDDTALKNYEMILMKAPNPGYSSQTFALYRSILDSHQSEFSTYPKEIASIFIRRCAVAAELLAYPYRGAEGEATSAPPHEVLAKSLSSVCFPKRNAAADGAHRQLGELGLVHFNREGEEDGSTYFELHKPGNKPMAHLKQLNSANELIPVLQIGISNFELRRVDVERGEFDAEFICSTTIASDLKQGVLNAMKKIWDDEAKGESIPEDTSATGDPRGKLVQYPMLSGLLSIPNMRAEGSVAQIGQTDRTVTGTEYRVYKVRGTFAANLNTMRYPFDHHQIGVELQAAVPDHLLTLTSQSVEKPKDINQHGWMVQWVDALVDNRVANGNPLAMADHRTETRQFKEFAIMVGVERNILQPILVVMLPLVLLGLAGIGIMYLGEKEAMGKSPSELAMGVVLAIVAYSISYADVVPRSGGYTHSDLLYLVTTLLCMGNFGAILVFGEMGNVRTRNDFADRLRKRYAIGISIFYALFLLYWCFGSGMLQVKGA